MWETTAVSVTGEPQWGLKMQMTRLFLIVVWLVLQRKIIKTEPWTSSTWISMGGALARVWRSRSFWLFFAVFGFLFFVVLVFILWPRHAILLCKKVQVSWERCFFCSRWACVSLKWSSLFFFSLLFYSPSLSHENMS